MNWGLQLFIASWFGYELVNSLSKQHFNIFEKFFAGIPLGFYTYSWLLYILSSHTELKKHLSYPPLLILLTATVALKYYNHKRHDPAKVKFPPLQLFTLLSSFAFFIYLMYISMLHDNMQSIGAGYGDLPFHLNIISSFATGKDHNMNGIFNVSSIFYSGERLAYPFIPNFFTGSLIATGDATLRASLLYPSILICFSLIYGMYTLFYEFDKNHATCFLSIFLFINLGGLGWIKLFKKHGYGDFIHNFADGEYAYWFHPLMHVLIPQRATLWSQPLCYWTFISLIRGMREKSTFLFLLAALYVGFTPLVQMHSYVGLAQWSIVYCILTFPWKKLSQWPEHIKFWAVFAIAANVIAIPQLYPYLNRVKSNSKFVQLNPIWNMYRPNIKFRPIVLWWKGLGIFAVIALLLGWPVLSSDQIILYIPSIVVFLTTNFIRYQPWELDNTKVFYAAWIPLATPVVAKYFILLYKKWKILTLVLVAATVFSALRFTFICCSSYSSIYQQKDVSFGYWVNENTPQKAGFVTSTWHAHPVASIAGRQLFMGYGGWVISHGLNYNQRDDLKQILIEEPNNTEPYQRSDMNYVVNRNNEFKTFNNEYSIAEKWALAFDLDGYKVFRRRQ